MNELSPVVSFDVELGRYVNTFEINYEFLVNYMQQRGFDDQTIAASRIHISAATDTERVRHFSGHLTTHTAGKYNQEEDLITLSPRHNIALVGKRRGSHSADDTGFLTDLYDSYDQQFSIGLSRTLLHELEHKMLRNDPAMDADNKKYEHSYLRKSAGRVLLASGSIDALFYASEQISGHHVENPVVALVAGSIIMLAGVRLAGRFESRHQHYLDRPEEVRCRQAEQAGPTDFLSFHSRPLP